MEEWANPPFQRSDAGVVLCLHGCATQGSCRLGVLAESIDAQGVARFDLLCPQEHDKGGGTGAHAGWATSVLCEMVGHSQILAGRPSHLGTLSVRSNKTIPVAMPLQGRVLVDRRERRKTFVSAAITSSAGSELVVATAVLIALEADDDASPAPGR